jgi:hypothetical protein
MRIILVVIALMSTTAHAEERERLRIGGGIQFFRPPTVGASFFLGLSGPHAVHVKVARYLPVQSIEAEEDYHGGIYDVGMSYVLFQHRFLSGLGLEVGPFYRNYDLKQGGRTVRDNERLGGRALLALYFPLDRMFVAVAFGAAALSDGEREVDGYFRVGFRN